MHPYEIQRLLRERRRHAGRNVRDLRVEGLGGEREGRGRAADQDGDRVLELLPALPQRRPFGLGVEELGGGLIDGLLIDSGDAADVNNRARTVTLEVTSRMGEVVAVAARLGSLSLALRSFATGTRDPAAVVPAASQQAPVWAGDISRAVRDLPRVRGPQGTVTNFGPTLPPAVTIYRGSDRNDAMSNVAQSSGAAGNNVPPLPSLPAPR